MRALRRAKRESALLIALADIGGVWDVVATTEALTRFADAAVSAALRFLLRRAANRGTARASIPRAPEIEAACGLVVLALGKHGARELNYSSDVDLIVFYDSASARDPAGRGARLRCSCASRRRSRGSCRSAPRTATCCGSICGLRPDPGATPVAMSIASAASYYETLGQNWERAALDQGAPGGRRPRARRATSSTNSRPSSGASISTTPRSPTCMR